MSKEGLAPAAHTGQLRDIITSGRWALAGTAFAASCGLALPAAAQAPLVISDLSSPRGLSVSGSSLLIADQGNGRILRVARDGTVEIVLDGVAATPAAPGGPGIPPGGGVPPGGPGGPPPGGLPPGGPPPGGAGGPPGAGPGGPPPGSVPPGEPIGISAAIEANGTIFYLTNQAECGCVWSVAPGGTPARLADLTAFEEANNTNGDVLASGEPDYDSNPFDIVTDGAGGVYASDAGANAVLHVNAAGDISAFAAFPDRVNPTPDIGGPFMDQVPTGLAIGPDGAVYVATLTGLPFPTGAARVYRLADGNGDGDALDEGEVTIAAEGATSATDVAFDADGAILVTEVSTDQLNGTPGRLVRIKGGTVEEVAAPLMQPTGVAVLPDGTIVVAQEAIGVVAEAGAAVQRALASSTD